jgi:import inner membrane translocase subunit TIM8
MSANDAQMQQFLEVRSSSRRRLYVVVVTRRNERKNQPRLTQSSSHSFRRTRAQEEKRKAVFNEVVAKLTDTCFEKCVTYAPGAKFSSSEASCLTNCALRYLESGRVVLERLQGGR